jgi:membrane protein
MRATDKTPDASENKHTPQAPSATEDTTEHTDQEKARRNPRVVRWAKAKFAGSWADDLWSRLGAVDFMNESILLAATFLLCAVPFMIIASALSGRSAVTTLSTRLGLNHQAASDVGHLFASSSATSAAITGTSWVFFILGGVAAASSIQILYQKVFQLRPGKWDKLRSLVWLGLVVVWTGLGTAAAHPFYKDMPVLWWIVNIPAFIAFWWFTMWFLLGGRVAWRRLVPCAVATGLFWLGMLLVFRFTFSNMVTSSDNEYGPIGVVFDLMSFFIAIGVVITLGATTGMMWHDRGLSFRAAARKLRRPS